MNKLTHLIIPHYNPFTGLEMPYEVSKISAVVADTTDQAIYEAIINFAKTEGITDLYLIDKQFVADALNEKIETTKGGKKMSFHETMYGKRFFDNQLPKLINSLNRIADILEDKDKEENKPEDVCEWKSGDINNIWKPGCEPAAAYTCSGVAWFKRCPYCGRPLKLKK